MENINLDLGEEARPRLFPSKPAFIIIGLTLALTMAGGLATDIGPWYYGLKQPGFKPPDWAFGPAWTLIFGLGAYAAIHAWFGAQDRATKRRVMMLFGINAVLNVLWSVLFFALKRPDWALVEVVPFWLSIVALIIGLKRVSPVIVPALMPYLVWVAYASAINWAVVDMNGPFG